MHSSHADASQLAGWKAAANTGVIAVAIIILIVIFIDRVASKPKPYQLFPVWATLEIGLTSHLFSENGLGRRILMLLRRNSGSLVGLSSKHQILIDSPHITRLMAKSILDPLPSQYTLLVRVFGGVDSLQFKEKLDASNRDLRTPIEKVFMNENAATAALEKACIPEKVKSFVTFQSNPRDMELWEHSAQIRVINPESSGVEKVEANFQSLVRDFGACIAIPQLYGRDFLDRYPQALEDLWKFDNDLFPLLMIGLPLWAPLKVLKEGLAARTRLITELEALYRRIDQHQQGDPVDFDADMRDVGETALGRNNVYRREGWSFPERGAGDLGLLWGQNANTQPLLFWLLTYVYSTPEILEQLREELTPYVTMSSTIPRELISLDMRGLSRDCPLGLSVQAQFTLRTEN
ncbi:uncharacterized protein J4E79_003395 [Alternaria viburni]|uniref:uncharacterized protein n=1 Tax=Alternaria viburni TaxID=566460 RepID=UPI0020C369BD|nr:uncharacterized protein J4E79_003395 [Alternaria viburni]KAI4665095.1 hypothetical protein J4E79_003395 [Alternaria viburni]